MRSHILVLGTILCLLLAAVPAAGQAQTQWRTTVPFEFMIGDTLMPAGDYTILSDPATGLVIFRNDNGGHLLARYTRNIPVRQAVEKTELKFMMSGGKHVLHQLWMQGDMHGHDVLHGEAVPDMDPR